MKKTKLYKTIERAYPGIIEEALKTARLKLMASPDMIRSLINMDQAVARIVNPRH